MEAELLAAERERNWALVCELCSRGLAVGADWLHDFHRGLLVKVSRASAAGRLPLVASSHSSSSSWLGLAWLFPALLCSQRARALIALESDPAQALKDLGLAKDISPQNFEVLGDIAVDEAQALMQMRQFEQAFLALKRAQRCKVDEGRIHTHTHTHTHTPMYKTTSSLGSVTIECRAPLKNSNTSCGLLLRQPSAARRSPGHLELASMSAASKRWVLAGMRLDRKSHRWVGSIDQH